MPTISRTGISNGSAIDASHITNIIDALDGTSATATVIATGSFSGTLVGSATSASFASTASYVLNAVSASFASTASYNLNAVSASFASSATSASYALSSSFATTASYALNAGSSGQDYYTIQFKGNNFSGLGNSSTKYYPLITGDVSTSSGSAIILNSFISPLTATAVSMSVSVYNVSAGASETLRFSFENTTSKVSGTTSVNLTFTGKSSSGRGPVGNISVSAGDVLSYALLCSSGTFPTGSYVDLSILLRS